MNAPMSIDDLAKPHPIQTEGPTVSPFEAECDESNESESVSGAEEAACDSPGITPPASAISNKRPSGHTPTRRVVAQRVGESHASASKSAARAPLAEASEAKSPVSTSSSPDRKSWMRACNGCGIELHVRRTKCTECGMVQMSKRAALTAKEEAVRHEQEARERAALAEEAERAASSLKLIAQTSAPSPEDALTLLAVKQGAAAKASAAVEAPAAAEVAAPAAPAPAPAPALPDAPEAPPAAASSAATRALALKQAMARLSPEAMLKLRRYHKLRALLEKVPAAVQAQLRAEESAACARGGAADAIAMLADAACR